MTERLAIVEDLARRAGKMALDMRATVSASLKPDGSFVTEADIAVQEFLFAELADRFVGYGQMGEETCCDPDSGDAAGPVFVIDPIDGTDAYRSGLAYFSVSIGLYEGGGFPLGVVYLPVFNEMYSVDAGGPPMKNGNPVGVCTECEITSNSFLAAPSSFHKNFTTDFPGKIRSLGSTAFHLALVAAGSTVGAVPCAYIWDIAAGVALVQAAGGRVARLDGAPLDAGRYLDGTRLPADLLTAPDRLFSKIAGRIFPKP